MSKIETYLRCLSTGPKTNAELADAADEISAYVSRSMARLYDRGWITKSRYGPRLQYAITDAGTAALIRMSTKQGGALAE